MLVLVRATYLFLGISIGYYYCTRDQYQTTQTEAVVYSRQLLIFNAAKLGCIRGTGGNWNKCWVISNEIYEEIQR